MIMNIKVEAAIIHDLISLLNKTQNMRASGGAEQYEHGQDLLRLAGFIAAPYLNKKYEWMASEGLAKRDIAQNIIEDIMGWAINEDYGLEPETAKIAGEVINTLLLVEGGETPPLYDAKPNDRRKPKKKPVSHSRNLILASHRAEWIKELPELVGRAEPTSVEEAKKLAAKEHDVTYDQLLHFQKAKK
jgi:NAD(P)H-hydrate repair Nnr-like enzyme with NAD(P)H-hydrate dehydratase domain